MAGRDTSDGRFFIVHAFSVSVCFSAGRGRWQHEPGFDKPWARLIIFHPILAFTTTQKFRALFASQ